MSRKQMLTNSGTFALGCALVASLGIAQPAPAEAAESAAPAAPAEVGAVIVTARKREELDLNVPVVVAAISGEALQKQGATNLYDIAQMIPQLEIAQGPSSTGGVIALRGISSGTTVSSDQTVALNIDGITITNAMALRIGQFDLKQIQVLKGPQALFFGKDSPAGVLSFISEGPTPVWGGYLLSSYEFNADEARVEGAIGGPLTDMFGIRIAGFYDDMQGYLKNPLPPGYAPGLVFGPHSARVPDTQEEGGRLTLDFRPSDRLTMTLKLAAVRSLGTSSANELQRISCPTGIHGGVEEVPGRPFTECSINTIANPLGVVSPAIAAADPAFAGGDYDYLEQFVNTLDIEYKIRPDLTLTSITGDYQSYYHGLNLNDGPVPNVITDLPIERREISQEIRLTSSFSGPFNFTTGFYYQSTSLKYSPDIYRGPGAPGHTTNDFMGVQGDFNSSRYTFEGETLSPFVQGSFKIIPTLELAGGARYTEETKNETVSDRSGVDKTALLSPNRLKVTNISPEVTLTYRPTEDLTIFGAYKTGYKSGGFVAGSTSIFTVPTTNAFGPEHTKGGEAGIKARLFGRSLRVNADVYDYDISGLQVSAFDPIRGAIFTLNAASATIRGVEGDFAYKPDQLPGLTISGAGGYNRARYGTFVATCYGGQTIAEGCNLLPVAGRFTSQNLGGFPLTFAPDWSGNLNVVYGFPVVQGYRLELGGGLRYNSSFYADGTHAPDTISRSVTFFDAQIRLISERRHWELALIGRNLTNQLRPVEATEVAFSGTTAGFATATRADEVAFVNRPREVELQLTVKW